MYTVLHLTKLPWFASFHTELLKPPEEHNKNEYEFAGVAPPPGEARPPICAGLVRVDLSTATVAHWEPHISISTACKTFKISQVRSQAIGKHYSCILKIFLSFCQKKSFLSYILLTARYACRYVSSPSCFEPYKVTCLTTSTMMLSTLKLRGSSLSFFLSVMQMAMTKMAKYESCDRTVVLSNLIPWLSEG